MRSDAVRVEPAEKLFGTLIGVLDEVRKCLDRIPGGICGEFEGEPVVAKRRRTVVL